MRADEVNRLRRICELFRDVRVHPGPVVVDSSNRDSVVLNVQVRVVLQLDPALYARFEAAMRETAQDETTKMMTNALAEYAELTERLTSSYEALQLVAEEFIAQKTRGAP